MVDQRWVIAFDGSQKLARSWPFAPEALHRQHGTDGATTYSAYVLQATLVGPQGVRIPLGTEFCTNAPEPAAAEEETAAAPGEVPAGAPDPAAGQAPPASAAQQKQDCEVKAFQRLAARIKRAFRRRRLLVLADGLYANGPIMALCRQYSWVFLLVLRDDSLPAFWKGRGASEGTGPSADGPAGHCPRLARTPPRRITPRAPHPSGKRSTPYTVWPRSRPATGSGAGGSSTSGGSTTHGMNSGPTTVSTSI